MTIDPLIDPDPSLLAVAAEDPRVRVSFDAALAALARLRFHEGLRRGWAEARVEAAVREGAAVALLLGANVSVDDLRLAALGGEGERGRDPAMDLAIGAWRSQVGLVERFAPLNSRTPQAVRPLPAPALLAAIHRDLCSGLVESGRLGTGGVAVPVSPGVLAPALEYLRAPAPAMARAAALVAHFRFREVVAPASAGAGAALARWLLVSEGVDPTGVCPITAMDARDAAGAARALAGWARADAAGVAAWMIRFGECVEYGARVGADVALRVQAGRLG